MRRDAIQDLLLHCYERQERLGAESAFRFALVMGPNRKRIFATYPETEQQTENQEKRTSKGKGKQRERQLDGLLSLSDAHGEQITKSPLTQATGSSRTMPAQSSAQTEAAPAQSGIDLSLIHI